LDGIVYRKDMAKMMVNYAIRILARIPSTWTECIFDDMNNQSLEARFYSKLACQLGIMGIDLDWSPAETFTPNGIVTRAEFGTILSRTLYGNIYDGWSPYYLNHLKALKTFGIITNTTPSLRELRGYAMLMLMRAEIQK
jgi:hypothetical protein